jgi:hypothetical protein
MASDTPDVLLYARLVDLHRRKTEAEMLGHSTIVYDALIKVYQLELAEIDAACRQKLTAFKAAV